MKKISSTVKTSIIILIVLLAFGGIKIYGEFRANEETKNISISADVPLTNALDTLVEANTDKVELSKELIKFMEWKKVYNPTSDALQTVTRLIKEGADIDALISVCIF